MAGPTPYPIIRLVDSPFRPPTSRVLMDFNIDDTFPLQDGWSLGAPALSGGSGVVGAIGTIFGPRTVSITQRFKGLKEQVIARMHQMHTAVLRGSGYIMFQLSEEEFPVFIPVTRSPADEVQFTIVETGVDHVDTYDITVRFTAFPWALGELVTLGPLEISNDPDSGTNRLGLALPQILGNYGVPVTIDWYHHDPGGPALLGSIGPGTLGLTPTYDVDATNRPVWAGMVTDTDGTYGPGNAPSAVAPGRYTVFAAGRPTGTGMRFGISYDGGTTIMWGPWDRTPSGSGWFNLGDFTFRPPPGVTTAQVPMITWEYEAPSAGAQPIPTLVLHPILNAAAGEYGKLMSKITSTGPGSSAGALSTGGEGHFHIDADGRQHTAVVAAAGSAAWQWPVQVPGASQLLAWPQHENWLTVLDDFYATLPSATHSTWVTITYHPYNHTFPGDR